MGKIARFTTWLVMCLLASTAHGQNTTWRVWQHQTTKADGYVFSPMVMYYQNKETTSETNRNILNIFDQYSGLTEEKSIDLARKYMTQDDQSRLSADELAELMAIREVYIFWKDAVDGPDQWYDCHARAYRAYEVISWLASKRRLKYFHLKPDDLGQNQNLSSYPSRKISSNSAISIQQDMVLNFARIWGRAHTHVGVPLMREKDNSTWIFDPYYSEGLLTIFKIRQVIKSAETFERRH